MATHRGLRTAAIHALVLLPLLLSCSKGTWDPPALDLPALPDVTAKVTLHLESDDRVVSGPLRATRGDRQVGLMYRKNRLAVGECMLFMMDTDDNHSFWMANTFIPLDMVFIDAGGTVVGIVPDVTPKTRKGRSVGKKSRFVLELDAGWAKRFGLRAGAKVDFTFVPVGG